MEAQLGHDTNTHLHLPNSKCLQITSHHTTHKFSPSLKHKISTMPLFIFLNFYRDANIQWVIHTSSQSANISNSYRFFWGFFEILYFFCFVFVILCTRVDTHKKWGDKYEDKQLICEYFKMLSVFLGFFEIFIFLFVLFL